MPNSIKVNESMSSDSLRFSLAAGAVEVDDDDGVAFVRGCG